MTADRRAIRAVADDGYEPFRRDNARSGKTEAARSARREQALLTCAGETSCAGISKMRLEVDMRRPILTTASVIALGVGLALAGATQANAWSHHAAMHSSRMHMSRAEISDVQQKLQADNLYRGKVDGMLGPETRRAIADYQKQNGLRVTANLDQQTRDSLLGNMGTATPPASATRMTPAPSQGGANAPAPNQGGASYHPTPGAGNSATGR
jgi:hypothetical protein